MTDTTNAPDVADILAMASKYTSHKKIAEEAYAKGFRNGQVFDLLDQPAPDPVADAARKALRYETDNPHAHPANVTAVFRDALRALAGGADHG